MEPWRRHGAKVSNKKRGTGVAMNSDNLTIPSFQQTGGRSVNRSLDENRSIRYRPRYKIKLSKMRIVFPGNFTRLVSQNKVTAVKVFWLHEKSVKFEQCWKEILKLHLTYCMCQSTTLSGIVRNHFNYQIHDWSLLRTPSTALLQLDWTGGTSTEIFANFKHKVISFLHSIAFFTK